MLSSNRYHLTWFQSCEKNKWFFPNHHHHYHHEWIGIFFFHFSSLKVWFVNIFFRNQNDSHDLIMMISCYFNVHCPHWKVYSRIRNEILHFGCLFITKFSSSNIWQKNVWKWMIMDLGTLILWILFVFVNRHSNSTIEFRTNILFVCVKFSVFNFFFCKF